MISSTRRLLIVGMATIVALISVFGTSRANVVAAKHPKLTTVTIGMSSSASWIPVQIAQQRGFFKKHGINAKIQILTSAPAAAQALVAGDLDFACLATERSIEATQQGQPVVSVASIQDYPPATLLVPTGSTIKPGDFAALKGKTVGIVLGGWSEYLLRVELAKHGLKWTDIKTVSTPDPTTMLSALLNHQVDALGAIEPAQSLAIVSNLGKVFFDIENPKTLTHQWPHPFSATTLQATNVYAHAHKAVVKKVEAGLAEALKYVRQHPAVVTKEWAKSNPTQSKQVWKVAIHRLLNTWSKNGVITKAGLNKLQKMLIQLGVLTKTSSFKSVVFQP